MRKNGRAFCQLFQERSQLCGQIVCQQRGGSPLLSLGKLECQKKSLRKYLNIFGSRTRIILFSIQLPDSPVTPLGLLLEFSTQPWTAVATAAAAPIALVDKLSPPGRSWSFETQAKRASVSKSGWASRRPLRSFPCLEKECVPGLSGNAAGQRFRVERAQGKHTGRRIGLGGKVPQFRHKET